MEITSLTNLAASKRLQRQGVMRTADRVGRAAQYIACVAWRFWLGALSNKGGRGHRNREEIGAGAIKIYFFRGFAARSRALRARISRLRRSCARLYKTAMLRRLLSIFCS